ncbi:MAG: hypothetical protein PH343_06605 [Nitrospira sp.]|nr:hypothetical protein [Nitrospira sp.]
MITFRKYGGIYYIDEIDLEVDNIESGTIAFTTDTELIGTRIEQVSARNAKGDIILIRGKK